ncbi:50S ribosomal protein L17 [bacterium]|nr:50S ribosomal protein L17 [bacterium]
MRHRNRRGKLGRKSAHRMMMLRNMATSLFDKERIQTTLPKAKQLRPYAEKLITLARKGDLHARRLVLEQILKKEVVQKLFDDIAKRYANGKGGYLRIVHYSARWGDGAQRAFVELTTKPVVEEKGKPEKGAKKKAKGKEAEAAADPKKTRKKAASE